MEHGLKAGWYKIVSTLDGAVLTATTDGCPRTVKTAPYEEQEEQKWKVKVREEGDKKIQIIRNEKIKNNEVSKRGKADSAEGQKEEPVNWKFEPVEGKDNTFTLHNGEAFLTSTGTDNRVSFSEAVDAEGNKDSQSWTFEFLSEIAAK